MTDIFLMLPLEEGRSDDHLSVADRAIAAYLAELPAERIRAIVQEAITIAMLQAEAEILLREEE